MALFDDFNRNGVLVVKEDKSPLHDLREMRSQIRAMKIDDDLEGLEKISEISKRALPTAKLVSENMAIIEGYKKIGGDDAEVIGTLMDAIGGLIKDAAEEIEKARATK